MRRLETSDALGLHERASASPRSAQAVQPARHGAEPAFARAELSLELQQRWFAEIVCTPESELAPIDAASAARLVTPGRVLSSLERLDIYRRAYHARLIECLADDYPMLEETLGEPAFEALCRRYIARFPSQSPSLNFFGRHMSSLCESEPLPNAGFARDLAALEWAIVEAIHAPTASPLGPEDLARVPAPSWPEVRLKSNPSLRILELEYPVNAYFQAWRDGARPAIPAPSASLLAVYRTGRSVWRLELSAAMRALIASLASGVALGASIERALPLLEGDAQERPEELVSGWFASAVSSGLFSGLAP